MVHCSASVPAVSAVYWIMETIQCPLPPLCRGSQCLLSINWNVRGLTKTTFNECQQLLQVASDHAAATAALTAACSAAAPSAGNVEIWSTINMSCVCTSALCTSYEHYALTMHTFHKLCLTADLAVATSGEIRRLIPVSTNHQPGLSDMQPAAGAVINVQTIRQYKGESMLAEWDSAGIIIAAGWLGVESSIELFGCFHKLWFASESRASKSG